MARGYGKDMLLIDLETQEVVQFDTAHMEDASYSRSFSPDGRELWGIDVQAMQLSHFALLEESDSTWPANTWRKLLWLGTVG